MSVVNRVNIFQYLQPPFGNLAPISILMVSTRIPNHSMVYSFCVSWSTVCKCKISPDTVLCLIDPVCGVRAILIMTRIVRRIGKSSSLSQKQAEMTLPVFWITVVSEPPRLVLFGYITHSKRLGFNYSRFGFSRSFTILVSLPKRFCSPPRYSCSVI